MPRPSAPYRHLSVDQLIDLLEHAHDHPPEAIVVVWDELKRRGVARETILKRRRALAARTEAHRITPRAWAVKSGGPVPAIDARSRPRWRGTFGMRTEWVLMVVTVLMALIAASQLLGLLKSGILLLRPGEAVSPYVAFITVVGSVVAVFCCLAAYRLWQGRRIGWIMSVAFLAFQLLTPVFQVVRLILFGTSELFVARMDRVLLHGAVEQLLFGLFLYAPPLYVLCVHRIRHEFGVSTSTAVRTLLIAAAALLLEQLITLSY